MEKKLENLKHPKQSEVDAKKHWRAWAKTQSYEPGFDSSYLQVFLEQNAKQDSTWAVFSPFASEPMISWTKMGEQLKARNLSFAFPRTIDEDAARGMQFFKAKEFEPHPKLQFMQPVLDLNNLVTKTDLQGVFVPGLLFDNRGGRLGRGQGFYDRFLHDFKGIKVGLCRHEFYMLRPLPVQDWDVRMDYIVTDKFIFSAGQ